MGLFRWKKKDKKVTQEKNTKTEPVKATEPKEESSINEPDKVTHKRKQQYHVSHHKDGWKVKLSSGEKAIKVFKTQAEAIEYAKHLCETHDTTFVIHKKDGSIRKQKY